MHKQVFHRHLSAAVRASSTHCPPLTSHSLYEAGQTRILRIRPRSGRRTDRNFRLHTQGTEPNVSDSNVVRGSANQERQDLSVCFDGSRTFRLHFNFAPERVTRVSGLTCPAGNSFRIQAVPAVEQTRSFRICKKKHQQGVSGFTGCLQQPEPGVAGFVRVFASSRTQMFEDSHTGQQ